VSIFTSKEQMIQWAQKGMGSDQKFNEAAKMRQQSEKLIQLLRENPRKILEDPRIGIDLKKLAQEVLWEQIQQEKTINATLIREIEFVIEKSAAVTKTFERHYTQTKSWCDSIAASSK
jgi:hypothetical protein